MSVEFLGVPGHGETGRRPAKVDAAAGICATFRNLDDTRCVRRSDGEFSSDVSSEVGVDTGEPSASWVCERPMNDEGVKRDKRQVSVPLLGCGVEKLREICVASSIHTGGWLLLLLSIDLIYALDVFSGHSIVDTALACLFIWVSTFACFCVLVEEDED